MTKIEKFSWYASLSTRPLGLIWAAVSENGLCALAGGATETAFLADLQKMGNFSQIHPDKARLETVFAEIDEYLAGRLHIFTIPLDWSGIRGFQREVLEITYAIPYGETCTYQHIATQLGRPGAARAVGRAEATNPIPLVIPCHRVIGSDGSLHGYGMGGGIPTKRWLLDFEGSRRQMSLGL